MDKTSNILKVLGHPERLRILALLSHGELTVSEIVQIMNLSQPRITQYVKSLEAAGILERLKEGSWVFSRLNFQDEIASQIIKAVLKALPQADTTLISDYRRLESVRRERALLAERFFANVANDTTQLGDEYLPKADIEAAMLGLVGKGPFDYMVDLGTGTGRVLQLFSDRIARGSGIDNNSDMLRVARHNLAKDNYHHITVRHGDINATPLKAASADLVTLHQVLHYVDDPSQALREATRLLIPGGTLLTVDFDAHNIDLFREKYAHRRLGFTHDDMNRSLSNLGLKLKKKKTIKTEKSKPDVSLWLAHKPNTLQ